MDTDQYHQPDCISWALREGSVSDDILPDLIKTAARLAAERADELEIDAIANDDQGYLRYRDQIEYLLRLSTAKYRGRRTALFGSHREPRTLAIELPLDDEQAIECFIEFAPATIGARARRNGKEIFYTDDGGAGVVLCLDDAAETILRSWTLAHELEFEAVFEQQGRSSTLPD
jgi:hypothetical protein